MAAYTTIDNPELYFQAKTYTGDGTTSHALTLDGSENMQPNMIWIKCRSAAENHSLSDSVRGDSGEASGFYNLTPNTTAVEYGGGGNEYVGAIGSDGFTVGSNDVVNTNTETYVAWCWKETATAGFDIVGYDSTTSAKTESHSLSAVPHLIIIKRRDRGANNWVVYHHENTSAPETDFLRLNTTDATADNANMFNDTAPTSSVFSVGTGSEVNDGHTPASAYIAYLFTEKQGFSKFGSYAGNANADGVFIYTGFKPACFICKRADATVVNSWNIFDNKRNTFNETNCFVEADTSDAEDCASGGIDFLSNGIKIKTASARFNQSSSSYVYIAFAEAPLVNSEEVPCNAR